MGIVQEVELGWKDDPLGTVLEIKIWSYEQIVYAQPATRPEKWDAQNSQGF